MEGTVSLIFIGCCIFVPMIFAHLNRPKQSVGVIHYEVAPRQTQQRIFVQEQPTVKFTETHIPVQSKPQKSVKPQKPPIFDDCVEVLVSLGMKKASAKEKVIGLFDSKNYKTVEDFLMDVYKK